MASYGGAFIFGQDVRMQTTLLDANQQRNTFFGVDGFINLFGGNKGRQTVVRGTIVGSTPGDRSSNFRTFESYRDGYARTLVDTDGVTWENVILDDIKPTGDKLYDATNGVYIIEYQAIFSHATTS